MEESLHSPKEHGNEEEEEEEEEQQQQEQQQQQQSVDIPIPQTTNGHPPGFNPVADNKWLHHNTSPEPPDTTSNGHTPLFEPPTPPLPPPGFHNLSLEEKEPPQSTTPPSPPQSPPTTTCARFFSVPTHSTNIPVDLAKIVVDTYYPCITHGHSEQLLPFYTVDSQKSLSVGGAHAVCRSRGEFLLQLQSLQGSQFLVRGVVAQPGMSDSVVLLITGSVQNAATLQMLPFCHSLSLVRVNAEEQDNFQIQNDAMALLTE